MIRLRLSVGDVARMKFGISPLAEVAQSAYMLSERRVRRIHRRWLDGVRERLGVVDMDLLYAVIPPGRFIAGWFFDSVARRPTTIRDQLTVISEMALNSWIKD